MYKAKEIEILDDKKSIEVFTKNTEIVIKELEMYVDYKNNPDRILKAFSELSNKIKNLYVVDKPIFLYEGKEFYVATYCILEKEIVDFFSRFEKIFLYTIHERKTIDNEKDDYLVVRFAYIPSIGN